jgi:hypothetical protein
MLSNLIRRLFPVLLFIAILGKLILPIEASVSATAISNDFTIPRLFVTNPPSFVIAEKGVRHAFAPLYYPGLIFIVRDVAPASYTYRAELESGPQGMALTPDGVMHWVPSLSEIGTSPSFTIRFAVYENQREIFTELKTFSTTVLPTIPQLEERETFTSYEREEHATSTVAFSGFQPNNEDRRLFRWSLIDPPPGVSIYANGSFEWPDDRGYARAEPYTFRMRIDYETPNGVVSDEVTYSRRVLPAAATNDYSELRTYTQPQNFGMLGFSTAAGDGWLVAGEPFAAWSGNPNSGRVRLWKVNSRDGRYLEHSAIQPGFSVGSQSFGASVSLCKKDTLHPTRLAVGAPQATRSSGSGTLAAVGYVYVYACDESGNWDIEARLNPPVISQGLYFGGWVSIQGDTLIASMEGMSSPGFNAGALAVFRHNGTSWIFSQMLQAPEAAWGDYFSYPAEVSGDWIAAAANEDDDRGNNAGAVHLFQKQGNQFTHRQIIYAPAPEAGSLFGERLLLKGQWLFVSSFREQNKKGAVHVYQFTQGAWAFHQTLDAPFATAGSAFGVSLSCLDDVLTVSAPGYLLGDPAFSGNFPRWQGITLFKLEGGSWNWSRHVTASPDPQISQTWGFSITQLSPDSTVASIPEHQPQVDGQDFPQAGRLFLHRWPESFPDPFSRALSVLSRNQDAPARANDDHNQNGIPNIIDWMMGQDPGSGPDGWTALAPTSKRPFLQMEPNLRRMRFMIPSLRPGLKHRLVVETSSNLIDWKPAANTRWEAIEEVYFPTADGSRALHYFQPVFIPMEGAHPAPTTFVRLSASE